LFRKQGYRILEDDMYARSIDAANTGLDFSSWVEFGADLDFGIPGTEWPDPDWVRKTWSTNPGACNIMPRKGGRQGGMKDWEVVLGLKEDEMVKVCGKSELGRWAYIIAE
jgi:trichothecene 3-O-acetyltransferase